MASLGLNIIVFFFFTYRWGISHRPLSGEKNARKTELYRAIRWFRRKKAESEGCFHQYVGWVGGSKEQLSPQ